MVLDGIYLMARSTSKPCCHVNVDVEKENHALNILKKYHVYKKLSNIII